MQCYDSDCTGRKRKTRVALLYELGDRHCDVWSVYDVIVVGAESQPLGDDSHQSLNSPRNQSVFLKQKHSVGNVH